MTRVDWQSVDNDKVDDATLALLRLTLHDHDRVWKGFDWETMNRLHEKGFISDPKGKQKSSRSPSKARPVRKRYSRRCSYARGD